MSCISAFLPAFALIIVLLAHSSLAGLTVHEIPMQRLLENYEDLLAKVSGLVEEVAALKQSKEDLAVKVSGLVEDVAALNQSNIRLEEDLAALRSERRRERSSNSAATVLEDFDINEQGDRLCCTINRMPTSCGDLKLIGHTLAGFYTVKGDGVLRSIFCDFTKPSNVSAFQIPIGYFDVKTSSVNFYATKDIISPSGDVVVYQYAPTNVGEAMDIKTGIFTAPKTGKYYFSFSGKFRSTGDSGRCWAMLHKNTREVELGRSYCDITGWGKHCTYTVENTVNLIKGDRIFTSSTAINGSLYDDNLNPSHYTHFNGLLIEEDLSSILV